MHIAKTTPPVNRQPADIKERPITYSRRPAVAASPALVPILQRLIEMHGRGEPIAESKEPVTLWRPIATEHRGAGEIHHRYTRYNTRAIILTASGAYMSASQTTDLPTISVASTESDTKGRKFKLFHRKPEPEHITPVVTPVAIATPENPKRKLALLLPGHNEELIITQTIKSAIAAGQPIDDIYVVDDNSSDKTRKLAVKQLGKDHVLSVERSGKALAVHKAVAHFDIVDKYEWLHVADADSIFSANYFTIYRSKLDSDKYAVAVGFVQSLRGNWISTYRAHSYTYSQHVYRRVQAKLGAINVLPGPITSFRTDILPKIELNGNSLTEDFDITVQVHRKKLGKMVFIPGAVNYTQDPQTLDDFCKQSLRWYRGFFQGVRDHRIGLRPQKLDLTLGFNMIQAAILLVELLIVLPVYMYMTGKWWILPLIFMLDFVVNGLTIIFSTIVTRRWSILSTIPYFYFLRILELGLFYQSAFEVFVLRKFGATAAKGWATEGRRYELNSAALQDTAL